MCGRGTGQTLLASSAPFVLRTRTMRKLAWLPRVSRSLSICRLDAVHVAAARRPLTRAAGGTRGHRGGRTGTQRAPCARYAAAGCRTVRAVSHSYCRCARNFLRSAATMGRVAHRPPRCSACGGDGTARCPTAAFPATSSYQLGHPRGGGGCRICSCHCGIAG